MGRTVMLKEFFARVFLILFIIGMTSEAAPEDANSPNPKQQPSPGTKHASASIPGKTAS